MLNVLKGKRKIWQDFWENGNQIRPQNKGVVNDLDAVMCRGKDFCFVLGLMMTADILKISVLLLSTSIASNLWERNNMLKWLSGGFGAAILLSLKRKLRNQYFGG